MLINNEKHMIPIKYGKKLTLNAKNSALSWSKQFGKLSMTKTNVSCFAFIIVFICIHVLHCFDIIDSMFS